MSTDAGVASKSGTFVRLFNILPPHVYVGPFSEKGKMAIFGQISRAWGRNEVILTRTGADGIPALNTFSRAPEWNDHIIYILFRKGECYIIVCRYPLRQRLFFWPEFPWKQYYECPWGRLILPMNQAMISV